jgi:hypothetical protein
MGYSFKKLQANFWKYFNHFYNYLLYTIYWGSIPMIISYGLLAKPRSDIVIAAINFLTGKEPEQQAQYGYGMPPGY